MSRASDSAAVAEERLVETAAPAKARPAIEARVDVGLEFVDRLPPLEHVELDAALLAEQPHRHEAALTLERSLLIDERYGMAKRPMARLNAARLGSLPLKKT